MEIIKIEVYGGINTGGGGCSCGCTSCTPADAKAEYEVMEKAVLGKFGAEALSLEFVETGGVKLDAYPAVEKVFRAGGISVDAITEIVKEIQDNK